MNVYLGPVEVTWIAVNAAAVVITVIAYRDADLDADAVRRLNGRAREIAALGARRREVGRLVTQILLLLVAMPAVFSSREIELTPTLVVLMLVPVSILVNTYLDWRDRRRLTAQIAFDQAEQRRRVGDEPSAR